MASWFWYAVVAAVLYGAHQIFTRMAADHIGEGLGGFVVEATAAFSILLYLAFLWLISRWDQKSTGEGIFYSVLTGVCVGAGTIAFFLLFQKGGPLSSVPAILAGGAAIVAAAHRRCICNHRFVSAAPVMLQLWQSKTNAASHFKQLLRSPKAVLNYLVISFRMRPSAGSIRYAVSPLAAITPRAPLTVGTVAIR